MLTDSCRAELFQVEATVFEQASQIMVFHVIFVWVKQANHEGRETILN